VDHAAIFLDRDGTVNELAPDPVTGLFEGPLRVEDIRLVPGAAEAIGELVDAGYLIVLISNQPGAAKGFTALETIAAMHAKVLALLAAKDVPVDASRLCLHHPDGVVPELAIVCGCRKPAPGMILDAADELAIDLESSWVIGDSDVDIEAGKRAGCRTALVSYPPSAHRRSGVSADINGATLGEVVASLLEEVGC
jgi:D-glycero-D-manno-heptose 1,7-bisphosphate phosphatase